MAANSYPIDCWLLLSVFCCFVLSSEPMLLYTFRGINDMPSTPSTDTDTINVSLLLRGRTHVTELVFSLNAASNDDDDGDKLSQHIRFFCYRQRMFGRQQYALQRNAVKSGENIILGCLFRQLWGLTRMASRCAFSTFDFLYHNKGRERTWTSTQQTIKYTLNE